MTDSEYNLKLDSYPDHVKGLLKEIITDPVFKDVTLVFDDLQILKANRNILGACSPVLKNILQIDPSKSPLLYLKGLKITDIKAMINFVLFGEAKIPQDQMDDFLKSAQSLEIRELCKRELEQTVPVDVKADENIDSDSDTPSPDDSPDTKLEPIWTPDYSCKLCDNDYTGSKWGKDSLKIHMRREHEKIRYPCSRCVYQARGTSDLNRHIARIHEGIKFECDYEGCKYKNATKSGLRYHFQFKHQGIHYPCDMCGDRFMDPRSLKSHVKHKHNDSFVPKLQAIKEELYLSLSNLSVHHSAAFSFVKSTQPAENPCHHKVSPGR